MTLQELLHLDYWVFDLRLLEIAGTPVTVGTLVVFLLIVGLTYLISRLAQRAVAKALTARRLATEGTRGALQRLLHYLIMIVGLSVGLQTVGIDLSALFAAGAVFAIGIGFAMQNIAQNFVSGIILLLERTIKPGDILQVEGRTVKVTEMGIRATIARTLDEEELIIPNATIVQSVVTNYTLRDSLYRLRTIVGVAYGSDMALVRKTLEETAAAIEWAVKAKQPIILMSEFGNSAVLFEVSVWLDDPWSMRRRTSELNEAIWWALRDKEITIAFPQVDVHLDTPVVESLQALKAAI